MRNIKNIDGVVVPKAHAPNSNTAAVISVPAALVNRPTIAKVWGGYNTTPTGGSLTIEMTVGGTTVTLAAPVVEAGLFNVDFVPPIQGDLNSALTITLAAGGAGVSGKINALTQ